MVANGVMEWTAYSVVMNSASWYSRRSSSEGADAVEEPVFRPAFEIPWPGGE